jgi:6-phosphogluconolactonase (cycloisomerase 2 family)
MNRRNHSLLLSANHYKGVIMLRSIGPATFLALLMVGCGSGGDSSPPPATYTIGGTVTGLSGSGLVLGSDFGGELPISASGSFTFGTQLAVGSTFNVGVKTQPTSSPAQICQVANGTGTIAAANVTNVNVTCTSDVTSYAIHGAVSGLVGSGLTLRVCPILGHGPGGSGPGPTPPPCLSGALIGANGAFTLDYVLPASYSGSVVVSITEQPSSPWQQCRISNTTFPIQSASDTNVTVGCARFTYVTNAADNTLSAYSVDPVTGALTAIGTPIVAGVSPHGIVGVQYSFGVDKSYVFVGNGGSNDVSALVVNKTTGALTAVPGSPYPAGIDPQALLLWGDGLFAANAGSDNVSAYSINGSGALTELPGSPFAVGKGPTSIVAGPRDQFIFVANHGGSNDISAFAAEETVTPDGSIQINLTPVPGSPFPAGGNPLSLALGYSAGGNRIKFLYSANPDATHPSISGFRIDSATGALTPLSGSPFSLPVSHYIATDAWGAYLYVTSGATILGYAIDANTGALTALPGFPVAAGANAYSITVDPTNQFLYVANDGAANVSGFKLNALTGALIPMAGSPFPAGNHPDFIVTTF